MTDGPKDFDLIVIGSGPAGYRAAVQAAKLKKSVCIVEMTPNRLGGAWIHTGTIPSKTLREAMDAVHSIKFHAGAAWVERIIKDMSTAKLIGQAHKVSQFEENIVRRYFDRYKIKSLEGFATVEDRNTVRVMTQTGETRTLNGHYILLATGSRPRRPVDVPFDGWRVVDADEVLRLECLPKSVLIYGGGVIGCEYACIFAALGVDTTIVDGRPSIMQNVDHEISLALKKSMEQHAIKFVLGHRYQDIRVKGPIVTMKLDDDQVLEADVLFFASGRQPNSDRIGLSRVGVQTTDRGEITVNEHFQTTVPTIYAAGDVIGAPALAATSSEQGRHASLHMFGTKRKLFPKVFPIGVYTIPELSSVGASEQDLIAKGVEYVVGRAHYSEVARGYIRGDDHGLCKLLVCKRTHKILGIHILGHDACNLVHIGLAIMQKQGHAQDLVDMVFNYPTLAEAYRIAAFNALNKLFPEGEIGDPPDEEEEPSVDEDEESAEVEMVRTIAFKK